MFEPVQRAARAAAAVVTAAGLAACEINLNTEGFTTRETRSFTVSGAPDVTLETFDGSIEVHSWDRSEIEVAIEKRAMDQALIDQMAVEAEQQGDRIVLRVKGPSRAESRSESPRRSARSSGALPAQGASPWACTSRRPPGWSWRCRGRPPSWRPPPTGRFASRTWPAG